MVHQDTLADSFTEFVEDAEPRLRHALCAAFGPELGREAVAQALAYGWEHWSQVSAMPNPSGYLWGVGRNHARRRAKRRSDVLLPVPDSGRLPWVEPGLPAALACLSERQRTAVMLVYGLEWSFAEVAELLDVSKGTVQTQAERGMAKLRKELGGGDA